MAVEGSGADAGALGNFVDWGGQARSREDLASGLHDQFFVAFGVSAHTRSTLALDKRNASSG